MQPPRARGRPPAAYRRQRLRLRRRARRPRPSVRATHFSYQRGEGRRDLSQFTEWRPYEHRVVARVDGKLVPIPINRTTINELYDLELTTDEEVERFMTERAEPVEQVRNSEDVVVARVGRELYEKFFRGYTRKQWQRD